MKKILKLRDKGLTYTQIHSQLHCARSKVAYAIKNRDLILNIKIKPTLKIKKEKRIPYRYLLKVKIVEKDSDLNPYIRYRRKLIDKLPTSNTIAPYNYSRYTKGYLKGKYNYTYNQFLSSIFRYPYYMINHKVGWFPAFPKDFSNEIKLEIAKIWSNIPSIFELDLKEAIDITLKSIKLYKNTLEYKYWTASNIYFENRRKRKERKEKREKQEQESIEFGKYVQFVKGLELLYQISRNKAEIRAVKLINLPITAHNQLNAKEYELLKEYMRND